MITQPFVDIFPLLLFVSMFCRDVRCFYTQVTGGRCGKIDESKDMDREESCMRCCIRLSNGILSREDERRTTSGGESDWRFQTLDSRRDRSREREKRVCAFEHVLRVHTQDSIWLWAQSDIREKKVAENNSYEPKVCDDQTFPYETRDT